MQFIPHYVAYNSSLRVLYLQHQALILLLTTHYSLIVYSLPTTHSLYSLHLLLLLTTTHYYYYYSLLLTPTHQPPA